MRKCTERRDIPASNAFVPAAAGLIVGGEVVKDLVNEAHTMRITPADAPTNPYAQTASGKAKEKLDKYRQICIAKKNGTWVDDKVIKTLSSTEIK